MKRAVSVAVWVAGISLLLCLAPYSVGQQANTPPTIIGLPGTILLTSATPARAMVQPATLLAKFEPADLNKRRKDPGQPNVAAPEGGSSLAYLGIAATVCLGAIALSYRRKRYAGRC